MQYKTYGIGNGASCSSVTVRFMCLEAKRMESKLPAARVYITNGIAARPHKRSTNGGSGEAKSPISFSDAEICQGFGGVDLSKIAEIFGAGS